MRPYGALTRIGETGTFFLMLVVLGIGCASKGQVRDEVRRLAEREATIERLKAELAALDAEIDRAGSALAAQQPKIEEARTEAALASELARRAETTAAGSLLGETVFRMEGLRFEPGTAKLTEDARAALDQLADRLRAENAGYFIEVQSRRAGASPGLEAARAEAVRRYLHDDRGLPLHAVSTLTAIDESPAGGQLEAASVLEALPAEDQLAVVVVRAARSNP